MRKFISVVFLVISLPVAANYTTEIMQAWMGASIDEVTAKWGKPKPEDILKLDEKTTLYKYESFRSIAGGRLKCVVTFTIRDQAVVGFKYDGGHCPRIKRK